MYSWLFFAFLLFVHIETKSQGIVFLDNMNWEQVVHKAKAERKFIFVDCFTTWCKPCKEMDKEVYASSEVDSELSKQFVCVKVQMDSTAHDSPGVKKLYSFARKLEKENLVLAYPTYLFYSSTGALLNKGFGFMPAYQFVKLAKESTIPEKQYYMLLRRMVNKERFDDSLYQWMLAKAMTWKDTSGSRIVARSYIDYLEGAAKNKHIYNGIAMRLVSSYISSTDKNLFHKLYHEANNLDSVFRDTAFCKAVVTGIIEREELMKYLVKNENYRMPVSLYPDWEGIKKRIARKYNFDYAERAVLATKRKWYKLSRPDWNELAKAHISYIEKYVDIKSPNKIQLWGVNNILWNDIFLHVSDQSLLLKAASIGLAIVQQRPNNEAYMDTYANLLYRAGERKQALEWQERAVARNVNNKDNVANLEKMKQGIPTWTTK